MNRSVWLLCLVGMIAILHDGRLAPEELREFSARADNVPSEIRGELYEGRASLRADCERASHHVIAMPAVAESLWDRIRRRVGDVLPER